MKKTRFFSIIATLLAVLSIAAGAVEKQEFDMQDGIQDDTVDILEFGNLFESAVGVGDIIAAEDGDNVYVNINGISDIRTMDPITGEYVFSLDFALDSEHYAGVFVRGVMPGLIQKSGIPNHPAEHLMQFNYYETDWYNVIKKNGEPDRIGGAGIYVNLQSDGLLIGVKKYVEDGLTVATDTAVVAYPDGVTFEPNKFVNIKFYDDGSTVTVFVEDKQVATVEMSEPGKKYESDGVDEYEYFGKAVVKNSAGEVLFETVNTRLSSLDSQLAVATRTGNANLDNVVLLTGEGAIDADKNGEDISTDTTAADTTADTTAGVITAADTTAPATAADTTTADGASDKDGSDPTVIIVIVVAVVVIAGAAIFFVMKKKK